jgi:hypothetical protein
MVGDGSGHALIAVAIGNFVDQGVPAPMRAYYPTTRQPLGVPATAPGQFQTFPDERRGFRGFGR